MPRIEPLQLLTCLSVLLSPEGGIISSDEVPRLVNLMTKFSKKLVSKCVYILILKNTERSLVDMFMAEGGWTLIHTWLQEAIHVSNWELVKEILTLLLITPVDVERLKLNTIPKLVKGLSRLEENKGVQELSSQLVHDWLTIVKSNTKQDVPPPQQHQPQQQAIEIVDVNNIDVNSTKLEKEEAMVVQSIDSVDNCEIKSENADCDIKSETDAIATNTFYKVSVRDGKQVISRTVPVPDSEETEDPSKKPKEIKSETKEESDEKKKSKSRSSSSSKHSSSSSSSKSKSSSSSSSKDKDKDRHKSSSSSSSSKSSSRDKDKDKKDKDKYKHKSNGSKHSSSSSSSSNKDKDKGESKEKQAEKDKDTLAKIKPQSIDKLGRIPKKTDDSNKPKEPKKPTMSIEVRKNTEERPKTVKVYNSKRRTTGLEDEAKPAPPRPVKKPTTTPPPVIPPLKRPSPPREPLPTPPEKKLKIELTPPIERPGAIKLIPPKPKPSVLQESDIFMDALAASATTKKEPKKRKRRASISKETPSSPPPGDNPSTTTTTPTIPSSPTVTSPLGLKNIAAPNFYQDTLNTEEQEEKEDEDDNRIDNGRNTPTENQEIEERPVNTDGLKSALILTKRKGPKKAVRFNDSDLTQIRYFELDETERVNVTKPFMDMAKMEMSSEREALQLSRKLVNEDVMEAQTMWRLPYLIDQAEPLAVPGCKSLEKDIQFAREKSVLQALYFDKRKIPDSPEEPIPENYQVSDPIIIPLEDSESQEIDLRNTPWPEPKGSPPPPVQDTNLQPQMFPNMQMPFQNFPHNGPPQPFMPPRFPLGPNGPQGAPSLFGGPPNILPNGNLLGPPNLGPPQDLLHQGPLNPNAFGPGPGGPDNFNPMMNDNNFPMQFNQPNIGMFPPNNFNMNRGGGRGGFRRGGGNNGPWIRMNGPGPGPGPGNWNRGPPNNRGGGRLCKNVKNHGFCRNMDKCPFIHPK